MEYEDIYKLSMKFAPPQVDLRQAQILDDYGDESYAKLIVNHQKPDDVTRQEFDYYGWVYPFVKPEDLLFYLYPIVIEYIKDREIDCVDSFMYSMDRKLENLKECLTVQDLETLKSAFKLMWDIGGDGYADFAQCRNIQDFIGISVEL